MGTGSNWAFTTLYRFNHENRPLPSFRFWSQEYRTQKGNRVLGSQTFEYNEGTTKAYAHQVIEWWDGKRPTTGVEIEEAYKCRLCEYEEGCSWRTQKINELAQQRHLQKAGMRTTWCIIEQIPHTMHIILLNYGSLLTSHFPWIYHGSPGSRTISYTPIIQFQRQRSQKPRYRLPFINPKIHQISDPLKPLAILLHSILIHKLHCSFFPIENERLVCRCGKHACTTDTAVL